jgi:IPT/TIG domain
MNLFRRHIGRRVAGVGVGVALLMLGLEAPAFAAAPVVSSFTPTSGPATGGCVVQITGTALDDFPAGATTKVEFVAGASVLAAADYLIISDTEVWAATPTTMAPGTAYNIRFTNAGGTSTSTATFLATVATSAGTCAPTIEKMTPSCGSSGTTVVVTGTNLLMDVTGTGGFSGSIQGGLVSFSPYTSDATHTVPDVDGFDSLSVIVTSDAKDGPIKVTTAGTTAAPTNGLFAFSSTDFLVPPPDCLVAAGHARAISLKLVKKLVAKGKVSSTEDPAFTACVANVPVKIQRKKKGGGWKTVGKTTTSDTGAYKKKIKNKKGKYRSVAVKITLESGEVCLKAVSPVRKH